MSGPISPEAVQVINSILECNVPDENYIRDEAPPAAGERDDQVPENLPADVVKRARHHVDTCWRTERKLAEFVAYFAVKEHAELRAQLAAKTAELDAAKRALESDRSGVAVGITVIQKALNSRHWLTEGRGSYAQDDDRWHDEFKAAYLEIIEAMKPLKKIAGNLSECPKSSEEIVKARIDLEAANAKLTAELEAARRDNKWISVEERLPENCRSVLLIVRGDFRDPVAGYYSRKLIKFVWPGVDELIYSNPGEITHWAELRPPHPPSNTPAATPAPLTEVGQGTPSAVATAPDRSDSEIENVKRELNRQVYLNDKRAEEHAKEKSQLEAENVRLREALEEAGGVLATLILSGECTKDAVALCSELKAAIIAAAKSARTALQKGS